MKTLVALPVYNDGASVDGVVRGIREHLPGQDVDIIAINDGSTDDTASELLKVPAIGILTHAKNMGYGAALATAFHHAISGGYEALITIDADGQHDPVYLTKLIQALEHCDISSGSRYLRHHEKDTLVPGDRRRINHIITQELNDKLGLSLSDAFCGFKAYRVEGLKRLNITELGYAMPIQLWVQAVRAGLSIKEVAVPRIYLDPNRSFGAHLDQAEARLAYYRQILDREMGACSPFAIESCSGILVPASPCGFCG